MRQNKKDLKKYLYIIIKYLTLTPFINLIKTITTHNINLNKTYY